MWAKRNPVSLARIRIAPLMPAACSASSMLFPTLQPGHGRAFGIDDASVRHISGNQPLEPPQQHHLSTTWRGLIPLMKRW
jgi:hypothetical protein